MPISTGTTSHRAVCAIRQTLVRRAARFSATARVTLLSVWLTPCATTPLSAQRTKTARLERSSAVLPVRAAADSSVVSSAPSPPSGFARLAQWAWAAARAASSGGVMPSNRVLSVASVINCLVCSGKILPRPRTAPAGAYPPVQMREPRIEMLVCKAAGPLPAIGLEAVRAVPFSVESQWWNSCTGNCSPARKSRAVRPRRKGWRSQSGPAARPDALPGQDARHGPDAPLSVFQRLAEVEEAAALGRCGQACRDSPPDALPHGGVLAQGLGVGSGSRRAGTARRPLRRAGSRTGLNKDKLCPGGGRGPAFSA